MKRALPTVTCLVALAICLSFAGCARSEADRRLDRLEDIVDDLEKMALSDSIAYADYKALTERVEAWFEQSKAVLAGGAMTPEQKQRHKGLVERATAARTVILRRPMD